MKESNWGALGDRLVAGFIGGITVGTLLSVLTVIGLIAAPDASAIDGRTIVLFRVALMLYSTSVLGGLLVGLVAPIAKFWYGAMFTGFLGLLPLALAFAYLLGRDSPYSTSSGLIFAGVLGPITGLVLWILEGRDGPP